MGKIKKKKNLKQGPCSGGAYYLPGKMGTNIKHQEQCKMTSSKCSMKQTVRVGNSRGHYAHSPKVHWQYRVRDGHWGTSLAVQWLTLSSNARNTSSIPGLGTKIPHALGPKKKTKNQNLEQKQYCNKFNSLKLVYILKKILKKKKRCHWRM